MPCRDFVCFYTSCHLETQELAVCDLGFIKSLFLVLMVLSCKKTESSSELKWGMMSDLKVMSLFDIEPNRFIYVCDKSPSKDVSPITNIIFAVKEWAKSIKRDEALKIQDGCPPSGTDDGLILLWVTEVFQCKGQGDGCMRMDTTNQYDFKTIQHIELKPTKASNLGLALHEVGHAWGNCDRYGPDYLTNPDWDTPNKGLTCNGVNNGDFTKPSAMQMVGGKGHPQRVTEDDALGMQAIAQDLSIPANVVWQQFFANADITGKTSLRAKLENVNAQESSNHPNTEGSIP
jgi:hypothetical protein